VFDPADFILLAGHLAAGSASRGATAATSSPARVRAAYSRAYYGLYLCVRREIAARHGIHQKKLSHGALYTHLQSSTATKGMRRIGRELERLYTLRQKADYELAPAEPWRVQLEDATLAATLAERALDLSRMVPHLDFSPVVSLFT
jgi:hypothetical protein